MGANGVVGSVAWEMSSTLPVPTAASTVVWLALWSTWSFWFCRSASCTPIGVAGPLAPGLAFRAAIFLASAADCFWRAAICPWYCLITDVWREAR